MAINAAQLEELLGKPITLNQTSEPRISYYGRLGKTPDLNSTQWRYEYSLFFVKRGMASGGDIIHYVTIPDKRSELKSESIEADTLSHPTPLLPSNKQYEHYRALMKKT